MLSNDRGRIITLNSHFSIQTIVQLEKCECIICFLCKYSLICDRWSNSIQIHYISIQYILPKCSVFSIDPQRIPCRFHLVSPWSYQWSKNLYWKTVTFIIAVKRVGRNLCISLREEVFAGLTWNFNSRKFGLLSFNAAASWTNLGSFNSCFCPSKMIFFYFRHLKQ